MGGATILRVEATPRRNTVRVLTEWVLLCGVAFLLSFQLFIPPALSVADTNDFQKLAGKVCLGQYPEPVRFDYTAMRWRFSPAACTAWPFRSSAELALHAAVGLNRLFTSPVDFDLRWMGAVYAALFLASFVWLQRSLRAVPFAASVAAQLGFPIVACNAVYVPYLNTFFFDAATLVAITASLVGVSVLFLRAKVQIGAVLLTAASLTVLAASKSQHSLLAVVCIPVFWMRRGRGIFPPLWMRACATAAVLSGAAIAVGTTPPSYGGQAAFSALFYRILPSVPNPARYLAETRIPPSYIRFVGDHAFSPGAPVADLEGRVRFSKMFGESDLSAFFLRHPVIAARMLLIHLNEASFDRVRMKTGALAHRLGNYERETGKPPQALSHFFCFWPAVKHAVIAGRPRLYLAYILGLVAAAWLLAPGVPGMRALLATFTAMLAVSLMMVMTDGVESGRHLMIFNYLLDLLAAAVAVFALCHTRAHRSKDPSEARP